MAGLSRSRSLRRAAVVIGVCWLVGACSTGADEPPNGAGAARDSVFDPANPEGTDPPVPGTEVVLGDDVIIATEDGAVPPSSIEPPVDPEGPDAPPVVGAPIPTAAVVPVPEPEAIGRIVSMSPTHTETLFALGLGDFVIAADRGSDFPAEAQAVRRDDLNAESADMSTLLALEPDLVIVGDDPTGLVDRLNAAGVASYSGPRAASLADVYAQIGDIAALVGRPELGAGLVVSMQADIERIVASVPPGERTYFHEIDPSLTTVVAGSFIDSVYGELGLTSVISATDPTGIVQATSDQVTAARPDVIVLADTECCGVTLDEVAARPGWSSIPAVANGAVIEVPEALVLRWGPRVVDLVGLVAGGVAAAS